MPNHNPEQMPHEKIARAAEHANRTAEHLENSAEQAASYALDKVRQAREEAQSGIDQQRDEVAHRIRRLSKVLRTSGEQLAEDDPLAQQLLETAGASIERVAGYISTVTPSQLASDAQTFAQERPGLFFGGTFLLGLALGRFAKSTAGGLSSSDRELLAQQRGARRTVPRKPSPPLRTNQLPHGVGSTVASTVGTGSAHSPAANAAPSYGQPPTAAKAQPEQTASNQGVRAHSVGPGEGAKS